jgi:hypothetical protein
MFRHKFILLILAVFSACILSCNKSNSGQEYMLYGKWKASYGDTIRFSREGDRNVLLYDVNGSPGPPGDSKHEYTFSGGKLSIKETPGSSNPYRLLTTFRWIDEKQQFSINRNEWFLFLSSTGLPDFTFTKIP